MKHLNAHGEEPWITVSYHQKLPERLTGRNSRVFGYICKIDRMEKLYK